MITYVHIRDPRNTGDMVSCPADYFDLGPHQILNYTDPLPDGPLIIGGGCMMNWLQMGARLPAGPRIAWGIGSSRHGEKEPWPDPQGFALLGVREWSVDRQLSGTWLPCVSCMSPLLDEPPAPTREAVRFLNASPGIRSRYPVAADSLPTMTNDQPMEAIIEFLASAEVIVTNSYHGAFWATLLGRRVVCVPYSSKFHGFLHFPAMSYRGGDDWPQRAQEAAIHMGALRACRAATEAFAERVRRLL